MIPYEDFSGLLDAPTTAIVEAFVIKRFSSLSLGFLCIWFIVAKSRFEVRGWRAEGGRRKVRTKIGIVQRQVAGDTPRRCVAASSAAARRPLSTAPFMYPCHAMLVCSPAKNKRPHGCAS